VKVHNSDTELCRPDEPTGLTNCSLSKPVTQFDTTVPDGLRKGWREEVERDLQVLRVRRWRELVIDRDKWRGIVRQAKDQSGL